MTGAKRTSLALVLLAGLVLPGAVADEPLLPIHLGSWEQTAREQADAVDLERLAGEQAALLREYGAQRAERALYNTGDRQARVTLYDMLDRSAAYGAFTLLRAGGQRVDLGEAGVRFPDRLLFYQGNYLITIQGTQDAAAWQPLAARLQDRAGGQASLPSLPLFLPEKGFVTGSDRYLLGPLALRQVAPLAPGDWAGFAYGAEAEAARYRTESGSATLLLLSYPTPQIASQRLRDFERLFNLNAIGDPVQPLAFAKRKGTLVGFVAGLDSGQAAAELINQVRYEMKVSWSQPSETQPQLDWPRTVVRLLIGTGIFLLFALGSGLLFGGLRLLVKRLWPDKVFDRRTDTEIIQLDLDSRH